MVDVVVFKGDTSMVVDADKLAAEDDKAAVTLLMVEADLIVVVTWRRL